MTETRQPVSLFGGMNPVVEPTAVVALASAPEFNTSVSVPNNALTQQAKAFDLTVVDEQQVVLFASDRQKAIGTALDGLLTEITKEGSPVLFELFRKLKKGVEDADIATVEAEIRKSMEKGFFSGVMDSLGLSSVAKRLEAANEKIGQMLTSKSKSLLDLTREMEAQIQTEVLKLIANSKSLNALADEYRKNVTEFGVYVDVGKLVLSNAKNTLAAKQAHAAQTNAPLDIEEAKLFAQKVDLFETRLVTIETILQKAPAELEAIRLSQGASLATLGETANSALEEFNDIKSILIKLSVSHQIQSVQAINAERRQLRDKLQTHGTNLLGQTAVAAAQAQGQNRVDDAKKLLEFATNVNGIAKKVEDEKKLNQTRFAEARTNLLAVKKLIES